MKKINIQLPDSLEMSNEEIKIFIAAKLFEVGKLSLGQAAEISGLSLSDFMDKLFEYNISVFNYSATELEMEVKNAEESVSKRD